MGEHQCSRDELEWETEPIFEGELIYFVGKCPVCGKEYHQDFIEVGDGLWDVQGQEYAQI